VLDHWTLTAYGFVLGGIFLDKQGAERLCFLNPVKSFAKQKKIRDFI